MRNCEENKSMEFGEPVAEAIDTWIRKTGADARQLVRWCQGLDLPSVGVEEEPRFWIRLGLMHCQDRPNAEFHIVQSIAKIAKCWTGFLKDAKRPEQAGFNLLQLAADLAEPEVLNEPLQDLLRSRKVNGSWRGADVVSALRAAVTVNQNDGTLDNVWRATIRRMPDAYLGGTPMDGFRGLIHTGTAIERPDRRRIGIGLKEMAATLDYNHQKRPLFRECINEVEATYPKEWASDLLDEAHRTGWPKWAVECLPSLYIPSRDGICFVWSYLAACLPETYPFEQVSELCGGLVLKIKPQWNEDETTASRLRRVVNLFELSRKSNPFPTQQATVSRLIEDLKPEIEMLRQDGWGESEIPNVSRISVAFQRLSENVDQESDWEHVCAMATVTAMLYPDHQKELLETAGKAGVPEGVCQQLEAVAA